MFWDLFMTSSTANLCWFYRRETQWGQIIEALETKRAKDKGSAEAKLIKKILKRIKSKENNLDRLAKLNLQNWHVGIELPAEEWGFLDKMFPEQN